MQWRNRVPVPVRSVDNGQMAADFEKLGVFYLGKRKDNNDLLLYDSKDLVTHAVCVGMTGSGKTGLCIGLLEEAAIDNIPALVIDPKGDLSNLLLNFPGLTAEEFAPWVNEDEARAQNLEPAEFAAQQADLWTNGLAKWEENEKAGRGGGEIKATASEAIDGGGDDDERCDEAFGVGAAIAAALREWELLGAGVAWWMATEGGGGGGNLVGAVLEPC